MSYIVLASPPLTTVEQFDAIVDVVGEPEGMQGRWCGRTEGGELRIVSIWNSKEDADRFFAERLGPGVARALGPEPAGRPEMVGLEVLRSWTPTPVG